MSRRWLIAVFVGLGFSALIAALLRPGQFDLLPSKWTGMQSVDDGYWTSPTRRLADAGRQDAYDERIAIALALPQNAIATAALRIGLPFERARFFPSLLAAAVLAALAVGTRRWILFAAILAPPVLGHLSSDLGEGTACAITVGWALAVASRRLALAGALAAIGLSQKACGLFLGVGTLVAVVESRPRLTGLVRAALGGIAGLAATTLIAAVVFGDDPVGFLTRPLSATRETDSGIGWRGVPVQALFASYHGPAVWAAGTYFAAFVLLLVRDARPAVVAASIAGIAWVGVFPEPWRVVPVLPLLAALPRRQVERTPAGVDDEPAGSAWASRAALALVACQLAGAAVALWHVRDGRRASALELFGVAAPLLGAALFLRRRVGPEPTALLGWPRRLASVGIVASLSASVAMLIPPRERHGLDVAEEIAKKVPVDASLIGHTCLAARFHGTIYYASFEPLWEPELLRAAPSRLYRMRTARDGATPPAPAGYRVVESEPLRAALRSPEGVFRPLTLDRLER